MEVGVGLRGNQKDCWNAKFWGHAKQMLHYDQFVCSFRAKIGVVTYQDRMSSEFGKVLTLYIWTNYMQTSLKRQNNLAFF